MNESQIKKLAKTKNLKVRGKKKKSIKAFIRNNKWESQMLRSHPQSKKGIYVLTLLLKTSLKKEMKKNDYKGTLETLMPLVKV